MFSDAAVADVAGGVDDVPALALIDAVSGVWLFQTVAGAAGVEGGPEREKDILRD